MQCNFLLDRYYIFDSCLSVQTVDVVNAKNKQTSAYPVDSRLKVVMGG